MPVGIPIKYSEIYGEDLPDEKDLLSLIPRNIYQILGPSLISVADPNNEFDDGDILDKYISKENWRLKSEIRTLLRSDSNPRSLCNSLSSYEIMENYFLLDLPDSTSLSSPEIELIFWKAYLILNEKFNIRSNKSVNAFKGKANALNTHMITSINAHDIINYNQYNLIAAQLIKVVLLFGFLESDKKFKPYITKFLELKYCSTWQEYLKRTCAFIVPYVGKFSTTFHDINVPKDKAFEENCRFLETFSVEGSSYPEIPDFVGLRSNVLIKIKKGRYRIHSVLFLIESLFKNLRFYFTQNVHKAISKKKRVSIYSLISGEFSENVVMYYVLNSILSKEYLTVQGEDFKNFGHSSGEPDYFAMDEKSVLLFESKDVILRGDIKQSMNHELIFEALKDKFYKIDSSSGGIPQIAENALKVLDRTYRNVMGDMNEKGKMIYPILLIHDRQFDTPGLNNQLIRWFRKELREINNGQDLSKVFELTIVNNDTLLALQNGIKDSKFSFVRLIQLYHKQLTRKKKKAGADFDYLGQNYMSFSLFLEREIGHISADKTPELIKEFFEGVF